VEGLRYLCYMTVYNELAAYTASFDSPLCSSITPSLFYSRLKTYLFHKSCPVVSLLPPGLPSRTFACAVSSELIDFYF